MELERTVRKVFLVLDARWEVRWKDLEDYAREHDTLEGYLEVLDDFPYQRVAFDDGVVRDYNFAAQAQFRPSYDDSGYYNGMYEPCVEAGLPPEYCRGCLGLVSDLIALLERDGIADQKVLAAYAATKPPMEIPLRRLPFRKFDDSLPFPETFPCAFARPQTYRFKGIGHYGDNGFAYEFARARDTYDGTEGLRAELGEPFRREFFATLTHFTRILEPDELPDFPDDARLVVYMQSDGAITRLAVNGRWFPLWERFPSYGDPYACRCFRGHRYEIPVAELGLRRGAENKLTIEHIATGRGHGANVVFALAWREKIERPERQKRRKKMAKNYGIPSSPVENLALLRLCWKKENDPNTPQEYKFMPKEHDALEDALNTVEEKYQQWKQRSDEYLLLTAEWEDIQKSAYDLIGRARSFWRMRFGEGNTYEKTAGIDNTPRKKTRIVKALEDILTVSADNAGTDAELPPFLATAIQDFGQTARENLEQAEIARGEKLDSYQELKKVIKEKSIPALRACREYLYVVLPDGKHDQLLAEWGFEPWDYPTHHKPEPQHFVQTEYDSATDIVKLRLTDDLTADEYIIEQTRTKSPAPANWEPKDFEVAKTSEEPYFELGPLEEGFTYAFRARARNSAGYGDYSEVWKVEVV